VTEAQVAERRNVVEKLLAQVQNWREEAAAGIPPAQETIVMYGSGLTAPEQVDTEALRAATNDYVRAVKHVQGLDAFARQLRALI